MIELKIFCYESFIANIVVVSRTTNYFGYERIQINCSSILTNITAHITVHKTVGATYNNGTYNTFWAGTVSQSQVDNGTNIVYTWTMVSGQTIDCSYGPYDIEAQFDLPGTPQIISPDTYILTTTTISGVINTFSGNF